MNFSMGVKEAIVNTPTTYVVEATNSELLVKGFAKFTSSAIKSYSAQRYVPGTASELTFDVPAASDLGIDAGDSNVVVSFSIGVNSTRHSSEWATDLVTNGKTFVLDIKVDGGDDAAAIATKLIDAFDAYNEAWVNAQLPFTYTKPTATSIKLTASYFDLYFNSEVIFDVQHQVLSHVVTASNIVVGDMPRVDGKYLEENVRMSLPENAGAYVIRPGEMPQLGVGYTTVNVVAVGSADAGIDGGWAPHPNMGVAANDVTGNTEQAFTLYFNENACLESDGPVSKIVNFLAVTAGKGWDTAYKADGSNPTGNNDAEKLADFLA